MTIKVTQNEGKNKFKSPLEKAPTIETNHDISTRSVLQSTYTPLKSQTDTIENGQKPKRPWEKWNLLAQ